MTDKQPDGLSAGRVFNAIKEQLPPDQAALVYGQPHAERERIMGLEGNARETAIAALATKQKPVTGSKEIKA